MQLQEIFEKNRNTFLCNDSLFLNELKKNIINNFNLDPKIFT